MESEAVLGKTNSPLHGSVLWDKLIQALIICFLLDELGEEHTLTQSFIVLRCEVLSPLCRRV